MAARVAAGKRQAATKAHDAAGGRHEWSDIFDAASARSAFRTARRSIGEDVNSLVGDHLPATYFAEYQLLRTELTDLLVEHDLAFRPGEGVPSLGELCREIGDIEASYIEAFRTFRQDFGRRESDPAVARSISALRAWYADLDARLRVALESLSEDDIAGRRIVREDFDVADFSPLPAQELDIYREALLIFSGKVSVYLRLMGRDLPAHWAAWIG
jgi:hypothetical protein